MNSLLTIAASELMAASDVSVDDSRVAEALAKAIVESDEFETNPENAVEYGVSAAIEEIDSETYDAAFNVIQEQVSEEIEGQAKEIALRMLRELAAQDRAAKAEREADWQRKRKEVGAVA
jgi:hypothetical protein